MAGGDQFAGCGFQASRSNRSGLAGIVCASRRAAFRRIDSALKPSTNSSDAQVMARWSRYDLIAIHEVSNLPLVGWVTECLFQVIAERAERTGHCDGQ
jgi:hypothetical protein